LTAPRESASGVVPSSGSQPPRAVTGWKTIAGALLVALAPVAEQYVPGVTEKAATVIGSVGTILAVFGIRTAISKNGYGV
jgi:hypothetical protein